MFDWSINIGTLLHAVSMLTAGIVAFLSLKGDVKLQQNELTHVKEQLQILNESFAQLSRILTQIAVQDNRLTMLEKRFDDLAHGRGFVNP